MKNDQNTMEDIFVFSGIDKLTNYEVYLASKRQGDGFEWITATECKSGDVMNFKRLVTVDSAKEDIGRWQRDLGQLYRDTTITDIVAVSVQELNKAWENVFVIYFKLLGIKRLTKEPHRKDNVVLLKPLFGG
jgi:hypothetical protein